MTLTHFFNCFFPPVMKKFSSVENKDFQRLPLESSTRVPLVTLPPADGLPDLRPQSHVTGCDRPEASGSPVSNLWEDSGALPFVLMPEGQREASLFKGSRAVTPGGDSLLRSVSAQSKWQKYQNTARCRLPKRSRLDTEVPGGVFAKSVSGRCFGDTGQRQGDAVRGCSLDAARVQMIRGVLRQQQRGVSHDWASGGQAPPLDLEQTSRTEETPTEPGGPARRKHAAPGLSQVRKPPAWPRARSRVTALQQESSPFALGASGFRFFLVFCNLATVASVSVGEIRCLKVSGAVFGTEQALAAAGCVRQPS